MAVRSYTGAPIPADPTDVSSAGSAWWFAWTGLQNGDVGQPLQVPHLPDKTIHFSGTFGAGGTVKMRGSCLASPNPDVATDWFDLNDPQGNPISKTTSDPKGEAIEQNPRWIAPIVTAGDGATNIAATLTANGGRR